MRGGYDSTDLESFRERSNIFKPFKTPPEVKHIGMGLTKPLIIWIVVIKFKTSFVLDRSLKRFLFQIERIRPFVSFSFHRFIITRDSIAKVIDRYNCTEYTVDAFWQLLLSLIQQLKILLLQSLQSPGRLTFFARFSNVFLSMPFIRIFKVIFLLFACKRLFFKKNHFLDSPCCLKLYFRIDCSIVPSTDILHPLALPTPPNLRPTPPPSEQGMSYRGHDTPKSP